MKRSETHKGSRDEKSSKGNNFAIVLCSLCGSRLGSRAALIVLNEIMVSRNPNEDALLMKADQIRATRGRLKRRELRGEKVGAENKR